MIVDSHVHLVTGGMVKAAKKKLDKDFPGVLDKSIKKGKGLINADFIKFLSTTSLENLADLWEKELLKNRVDKAGFLPITGARTGELDEFLSINPEKFYGYIFIDNIDNPSSKSAAQSVKKWSKNGRFKGIKLYPSLNRTSVADKRLYPLYEAAGETGTPVLIHFGISTAPAADYRYTNPLDLQLPSRLFPETKFIIAHFGAGFFRETLLLGFHSENIFIDTSGTNNWRLFLPEIMPLSQVFKRAIDVYGAERILFGTDTLLNGTSGYRDLVLKEQKKALSSIKTPKNEKDLIMGGNAQRLFRL